MPEARVIFCTCPDEATAARLGADLVGRGLAACVNVLPAIRSIYRWQGSVNEDSEALMIIKTTDGAYPRLESWLQEHHPYDVPEIVALPVAGISEEYMAWVDDSVGT